MNDVEAKLSAERVERYRKLEAAFSQAYAAQRSIGEALPVVYHSGPFTGNTRESRRVLSLRVDFSQTLGGAAPCSVELKNLGIEGRALGDFIKQKLDERMKAIRAEMEKT